MLLATATLVHLAVIGDGVLYARWRIHKEVQKVLIAFPFTTNCGVVYDANKRQ